MTKDNTEARLRGKRSKFKGDTGEMIARRAMIDMGLEFIHRINTPWKITRDRTGRVTHAKAGNKVAGDWRAVAPWNGQSVLAEVKYRDNPTLPYSTLEDHQHRSLTEHQAVGGLSLLIWIHHEDPFVLIWPVDGFVPKKSIVLDYARRANWLRKTDA